MANLTPYQRGCNKLFFVRTINVLEEGGIYCWASTGLIYRRKGSKLIASKDAIDRIEEITDKKFVETYCEVADEKSV